MIEKAGLDGTGGVDGDPSSQDAGWMRVCSSDSLLERGEGVRFEVQAPEGPGTPLPAFVIRHGGRVHAYLNQCAHVPVELDWQPGRFLDDQGEYLICATHGATYRPHDGVCVAGPCRGRRLQALDCDEHSGDVWVRRP